MVKVAAAGRFSLADSVSHFAGLDGIDQAFLRLGDGVRARTVVLIGPTIAGAPAAATLD